MKSVFFLCVLLMTFSYSQPLKIVNEEPKKNLVKIEGYAVSEIPADFASFTFTIKGKGADLKTAVAMARKKIKLIMANLITAGLDKTNLTTSQFYSGQNFKDKAYFTSNKDYMAFMKVTVNLDNLDLLEPAIIIVSEHEIEKLSNIRFELKDFETEKMKTFEKALLKAEEKAKMIKKQLSIENMRVVFVDEIKVARLEYESNVMARRKVSLSQIEAAPAFYAETIKLNSKIVVHYEITF